MKTSINNQDLENLLSNAIDKEKEVIIDNTRVDKIMNKVTEFNLQASFETRWLNLKMAFVYGVSIAISINIGCIIGNLAEITSVSQSVGMDFISIGFGGIFLTV